MKTQDPHGIQQTRIMVDAIKQFMEQGSIDDTFFESLNDFRGVFKQMGEYLVELFFHVEAQKNNAIQDMFTRKNSSFISTSEFRPYTKKIKVIAFDSNLARLNLLKEKLEKQRDFELLATFQSAHQVVELCKKWSPDMVIMDIQMSGISGTEATKQIVNHFGNQIAVVIVTLYSSPFYIVQAMIAGARGFFTKNEGIEKLPDRLRNISKGDFQMNKEPALSFIRYMRYSSVLTNTQMKVLAGIILGKSREIIEKELGMSKEALRQNIYRIGKTLEVNGGEVGIREHFFNQEQLLLF